MPRFYCQQPLSEGQPVDLPTDIAHHLHVLRMAVGDTITLFNGDGGEYDAQLSEIGKKHAAALVTAHVARDSELGYAVELAQALPEGNKMDWIVEKAVELGVAAVQPLAARRCVVRLTGERAEKKLAHWEAVIEAAACQSGRTRLAALHPVAELRTWLAQPAAGARVLLSPRGTSTLAEWARANPAQPLTLMVGPEGGFSPEEEDAAIAAGALPLTMGARVLRTETAALAALAILQAHWD